MRPCFIIAHVFLQESFDVGFYPPEAVVNGSMSSIPQPPSGSVLILYNIAEKTLHSLSHPSAL